MVYPYSPDYLLFFKNSSNSLNYLTTCKCYLLIKEVKKLQSVADILWSIGGDRGNKVQMHSVPLNTVTMKTRVF